MEVELYAMYGPEWNEWPLAVPRVELPASVSTLTCGGVTGWSAPLDLLTILGMVACNITEGVRIKALCCCHCATYAGTYMHQDGILLMRQPSEAQLAAFYRPVCMALSGLESLDFSWSRCGKQTIAVILAAAPDLRAVVVRVDVHSHDHAPVHRAFRAFKFASLTTLTLRFDIDRLYFAEQQAQPVQLKVDLVECRSLETCIVQLEHNPKEGDKVAMVLEMLLQWSGHLNPFMLWYRGGGALGAPLQHFCRAACSVHACAQEAGVVPVGWGLGVRSACVMVFCLHVNTRTSTPWAGHHSATATGRPPGAPRP